MRRFTPVKNFQLRTPLTIHWSPFSHVLLLHPIPPSHPLPDFEVGIGHWEEDCVDKSIEHDVEIATSVDWTETQIENEIDMVVTFET